MTGPGTPDDETTGPYDQSETSITVVKDIGRILVAYNDGTDPDDRIQFTPGSRRVYPGASLLGWSYSDDDGKTWTYGGRVLPPTAQGWAILWSDPATATLGSHVYASNLAISQDRIPPQGYIEGAMANSVDYPDGACVARSDDGGKTFGIHQCFQRRTCHTDDSTSTGALCVGLGGGECPIGQFCRGDFYDGASMVASDDGTNKVYFATHDYHAGTPDVWVANGPTGMFVPMPRPFPNANFLFAHPRLRYAHGRLYIAQQFRAHVDGVLRSGIVATYWDGSAWASNVPNVTPLSQFVADQPDIWVGTRELRTANQFSFDVGDTEVRFFFTVRRDTTTYALATSVCSLNIAGHVYLGCPEFEPRWGTGVPPAPDIPGEQFNPNLKWAKDEAGNEWWQTSFLSTTGDPNSKNIRLLRARMVPGPFFTVWEQIAPHEVCSDLRGYWGDYDDLQVIRLRPGGGPPLFISAFTSSAPSCNEADRWTYTSRPVHVRATTFP